MEHPGIKPIKCRIPVKAMLTLKTHKIYWNKFRLFNILELEIFVIEDVNASKIVSY